MDDWSHMTIFNQSECFISVQQRYAMQKFVYHIVFWYSYGVTSLT